MIKTIVLLCILYCHDILHILHHAHQSMVAMAVGTDRADISVADVVTDRTILDVFTQMRDRRREMLHGLFRLLEQIQNQP